MGKSVQEVEFLKSISPYASLRVRSLIRSRRRREQGAAVQGSMYTWVVEVVEG